MMSKIFLVFCFLAIVVLMATVAQADNIEAEAANFANKRCNTDNPVCLQFMCNRCCGSCDGFGCIDSMCRTCCR